MFTAQYTEGDHAIIDFKDHTWTVYREQHQHQAQLYPRAGFSYQIDLYSLLSGCAQYQLNKLQKVQNNLVLRVPKTDHIFPHLVSLHWLPIDSQIQYKLAFLCYNCLSLTAPVKLDHQTHSHLLNHLWNHLFKLSYRLCACVCTQGFFVLFCLFFVWTVLFFAL